MLKAQHIRAVLLVMGTCLFLYQTYIAVELYMDGQYMMITQQHDVDTIEPPFILFCDVNVFTANSSYGYYDLVTFIAGNLRYRNQMGWELSENDTVRDMMEELFPINRRDYRVRLRSGDEHNWKNASYLTDVFVSPYGLCLKMDLDFSSGLSETKVELFKISNYKIMFVYPEMLFNGFIYLNDESNSRISVVRDDFESVHLYKVNLAARTHSPISTDCSTNCTQYTNCLAEYVKKITIGMLGCLPPWMEESVLTCTKTVPFNRTLFKSFEVINEDLFSSNIGSQCTKE